MVTFENIADMEPRKTEHPLDVGDAPNPVRSDIPVPILYLLNGADEREAFRKGRMLLAPGRRT